MLVLSRFIGEKVTIGENIFVSVVGIRGNKVRLAFEAPKDVSIWRTELAAPERGVVYAAVDSELLAACKAVMEFLSNGSPVHPGSLVQAQVFNAITRAEGEHR